ncbi:MAG: hypothetical protein AAF696_18485 [Bacteroidota bacterium]
MSKLDAKNSIALSFIIIGLLITFWGMGVGGEVIDQSINGTNVPLNNMDFYQWNWRIFMGLGGIFTGLGLAAFPSQKVIEKETGRYS